MMLGRALPMLSLLLPGVCLAQGSAATPGLGQLLKLVLGLVVVIGVIIVLARFLPRIGGMQSVDSGRFRVVSALSVGQRERIVLLQVGDRQMVVGVAPGHVNTLHVLDEPLETAPLSRTAGTDAGPDGWLARTLSGGRR
ncbi:MAG: flagellar biosynthetic protein FliO [Gammaproteobacteria bacterium]|nr:MAG: flagellar biosynthetic protein FliO [Gammaproteobacteria bacterium]